MAKLLRVTIGLLLLLFSHAAHAQKIWKEDPSTQKWSEGSNWYPQGVPDSQDHVKFMEDGAPTCQIDNGYEAEAGMIDLGVNGTSTARLEVSGTASLTVSGRFWITHDTGTASGILDIKDEATVTIDDTYLSVYTNGTINHSGGTLEFSVLTQAPLCVGGEYNLTSGSGEEDATLLDMTDLTLIIGPGDTGSSVVGGGTFVQNGPKTTVNAACIDIGPVVGGDGAYTLKAGTLEAGQISVGGLATGTFTMEGGTLAVTGTETVVLDVGCCSYDGTFSITGGTCTVAGGVRIDGPSSSPPGNGTLEMGDGTAISIGGDLVFGESAEFTVGELAGDSATITMTGTTGIDVDNYSTDGTKLSGLGKLSLECVGTGTENVSLEMAGEGPVGTPTTGQFKPENFVLDELALGNTDGTCKFTFAVVDQQDNQPNWTGDEVLYVRTLTVHPRVTLNAAWKTYFLIDNAPKRLYPGDANVDGEVGIADLSALADNYGDTDAGWIEGDFNQDREAGIADLCALADNYGRGDEGGGESAGQGQGESGTFPPSDLVSLEADDLGSPTGYPGLTRYKIYLAVKDGYNESHGVLALGFDGSFSGQMNQVWGEYRGIVKHTPTLKESGRYLTAAEEERDSHILGGDASHPILIGSSPDEDNDAPGPPGSLEGTGTWLAHDSDEDMAVSWQTGAQRLAVAHIVVPDGEQVTITGQGSYSWEVGDNHRYGQNAVSLTIGDEE